MTISARQRTGYVTAALGVIAAVGLWEGSRGVILPHFLRDLMLAPTVGAAIFSGGGAGFLIGSLSFGWLARRFGLKRLAGGGLAIWIAFMALFVIWRVPGPLYAASLLAGLGLSLLDLASGMSISLIYREKQAGMLNLLHGFFGVGALSGSLVAAGLVALFGTWRAPLLVVAALLLLFCLLFLRLPPLQIPQPEAGRRGLGPLPGDPLVWIATLALGAAVAAEIGMVIWLPTYLQEIKRLGEASSALGLTLFFVGFTATRLAATWLVGWAGPVRSVVALGLVGMVGLGALLLLPAGWYPVALLAGSGIAIAFATCVGLVATRYPDRVNQVYAVMYSCGGLAGIVTPPLMGWLGERLTLQVAMWVPLAGYLVVALLIYLYGWVEARTALPEGAPAS